MKLFFEKTEYKGEDEVRVCLVADNGCGVAEGYGTTKQEAKDNMIKQMNDELNTEIRRVTRRIHTALKLTVPK